MFSLELDRQNVNSKKELLEIFEKHKKRALGATNYAEAVKRAAALHVISPSSYQNLIDCGSRLSFDVFKTPTGELKRRLAGADFCKNKYCPMCMWRKSRKVALENYSILSQLERSGEYSFLFLTLTIPNCQLEELGSTLRTLSHNFTNFIRRKELKAAFVGYIKGLEIFGDHTSEGYAHPHYHVILVVKKSYFSKRSGLYITHERIKELWREYCPESTMIRIQAIKSNSGFGGGRGLLKAVLETSKYALKEEHLVNRSVDDLFIVIRETKGIRLYDRGGILRTMKPELEDDIITSGGYEYITTEFYFFHKLKLSYVLEESYYDSEKSLSFSSGAPPPTLSAAGGLCH